MSSELQKCRWCGKGEPDGYVWNLCKECYVKEAYERRPYSIDFDDELNALLKRMIGKVDTLEAKIESIGNHVIDRLDKLCHVTEQLEKRISKLENSVREIDDLNSYAINRVVYES